MTNDADKSPTLTTHSDHCGTSLKERLIVLIEEGLSFSDALNAFAERRSDDEQSYVQAAREKVANQEGSLEVDDNAVVSESDDGGAYVMGWVWVDAEEAGLPSGLDKEEAA